MKLRNNKQTLFSKDSRTFTVPHIAERYVLVLLAFGVIGSLIVLATQAATSSIGLEPESGTQSGNVTTENDSLASGGSYIKFGAAYTDIFVSPSGNDNNSGATEALAVKTIAKAITKINGNTRIRIKAGTYIEQLTVQNKSNVIIEPFGDGDVVINGAIPEYLNTVSWTKVQPYIYKRGTAGDQYKADGSNVIYGSDGQQQWTYDSLLKLQIRGTVNNLPGVFINDNFLLGTTGVYVATPTDQAPTGPLYIGGLDPTLYIKDSNNISINSAGSSKLKFMYGSYNISLKNSTNVTIKDLDITGGKSAVLAFDSSNVTVKNNNLHGTFGRNWDWADVKEGNIFNTMENQAVHIKPITKDINNIVVEGNEISGYFNGVNYGGTTAFFIDDSVIANNTIYDNIDDGIEIDSQYRRLVIKGNTVHDAYSPFSATAGAEGPVDVYENLFVANRAVSDDHGAATMGPFYSIKMNNDNTGLVEKNIHFYHNTFYYAGGVSIARRTVDSTPTSTTQGVSFINNIFYSYDGGIIKGTGRASDTIEWDGNVFYSEENVPYNYYAWNSLFDANHTYSNLDAIISGGAMPSTWQGNAEGNPGFNCVTPANAACFRATASITKPGSLQSIPSGFSESTRLNSRTRIGAFE